MSYVSITALGKYRVTAAVNERNEIESIQTHLGLHRGIGPEEGLVKIVGQPTTN